MRHATLFLTLTACVAAAAAHADDDPFVGAWRLDPQRCRYESGPPPEEMVIVMEKVAAGVHYHSRATYSGGRTSDADYTADYDERPTLVTGTTGILVPVALKRIDPWTVEARYARAFQVLASSRRVVDRQGENMTITTTVKNQDGTTSTNVCAYRRDLPLPRSTLP